MLCYQVLYIFGYINGTDLARDFSINNITYIIYPTYKKSLLYQLDKVSVMAYNNNMKEILYYTKENGRCPYNDWFKSLDLQTRVRIASRLERLIDGHYGEIRKLTNSELSEMKFKFGKGYRIYYIDLNDVLILFLAGGDKSTQNNDITKANQYYKDYIERLNING